jgi:hypothetical protein
VYEAKTAWMIMIATSAAIQYQVWYFVSVFIGIGRPRTADPTAAPRPDSG